jgi:hypothetical protein
MEFFELQQDMEERIFVDREELISIVTREYNTLYEQYSYNFFRVIEIYGMGGIGKSRFLRMLNADLFKQEYNKVFVSFEIKKREQVLDNLITIRKQLIYPMPRFDFALISYWDRNRVEKLDDSFMDSIKSNIAIIIADLVKDAVGASLPIPIPSFGDMVECLNSLIKKHRTRVAEKMLSIVGWSDQYLLDQMPILLGTDLKECLKKSTNPHVFIFDSYMQSQPYSESKEWLYQLIGSIQIGLFIISGREKLQWSDKENHIICYEIESLPEQAAKELLERYMQPQDYNLIPLIIKTTECIPIYMNLALDLYREGTNKHKELIDSALFTDKHMLVQKFIGHLPECFHGMILALAVIRVFDERILEHMNHKLNLGFPMLEFEQLCNATLINYIETTKDLYKFHDVFSSNATLVHSEKQKIRIFECYLRYISSHGIHYYKGDALTTIFLNILEIGREMFLLPEISNETSEMIVEIFLKLMSEKANFDIPPIPIQASSYYKDIILYIHAEIYRREDTIQTIQRLEAIRNPETFGRHNLSYRLLLLYKRSLLGEYAEFGNELEQINCRLSISDIGTWYYLKAKYYLSDYLVMKGNFSDAYQLALNTESECDYNLSLDDRFHLKRNIGHIKRFNMLIDDAEHEYSNLLNDYGNITSIAVYLHTNLCENACYFNSEVFDCHIQVAFALARKLKSVRNYGKLLYSQAIYDTVRKEYKTAQIRINESIAVNEKDGYQSGILFTLMAQAYLDYAIHAEVQTNTQSCIEQLLIKNDVYTYFHLPIYIMQGNLKKVECLRTQYKWLDFDHTVRQYNRFFKQLR